MRHDPFEVLAPLAPAVSVAAIGWAVHSRPVLIAAGAVTIGLGPTAAATVAALRTQNTWRGRLTVILPVAGANAAAVAMVATD